MDLNVAVLILCHRVPSFQLWERRSYGKENRTGCWFRSVHPCERSRETPEDHRGRDNQAEQEEVAVAQAGCGSKYGPHFKMRVQCPMIDRKSTRLNSSH